jgi:hypothetical protein
MSEKSEINMAILNTAVEKDTAMEMDVDVKKIKKKLLHKIFSFNMNPNFRLDVDSFQTDDSIYSNIKFKLEQAIFGSSDSENQFDENQFNVCQKCHNNILHKINSTSFNINIEKMLKSDIWFL